jgi:hypothetical protein
MVRKVMKLIDDEIGLFECRVCKEVALGIPNDEGEWDESSYYCENGCKIEKKGGKHGQTKKSSRN